VGAGISVVGSEKPVQGQKEDLGTRTLQGFTCQGYRNTFPAGQQTEHWFCQDPASGRKFLGSLLAQLPGGKSWWREDLQKVTQNVEVDPQIFEVPPDYRIVDQ
jgi:hypothetical protein